jgi:hypothetical protein
MSGWKVEVEGGRLNEKKNKKTYKCLFIWGFYIKLLG